MAMNERMVGLRKDIDNLVQEYNGLLHDKASTKDAIDKKDSEINDKIAEYTAESRTQAFNECIASGDAMLEAVRRLTYETVSVKDTTDDTTGVTSREVKTKDKPIDLLALNKAAGGIGADQNWPYLVERLNLLFTADRAKKLGLDPKVINDSFEMSDIAKSLKEGKTITSKTSLLKALQTTVEAMLGDGEEVKVVSHDVNYLFGIHAKKSNRKALTMSCANTNKFRSYVAEICHRIVTNESYSLEYKTAKTTTAS